MTNNLVSKVLGGVAAVTLLSGCASTVKMYYAESTIGKHRVTEEEAYANCRHPTYLGEFKPGMSEHVRLWMHFGGHKDRYARDLRKACEKDRVLCSRVEQIEPINYLAKRKEDQNK